MHGSQLHTLAHQITLCPSEIFRVFLLECKIWCIYVWRMTPGKMHTQFLNYLQGAYFLHLSATVKCHPIFWYQGSSENQFWGAATNGGVQGWQHSSTNSVYALMLCECMRHANEFFEEISCPPWSCQRQFQSLFEIWALHGTTHHYPTTSAACFTWRYVQLPGCKELNRQSPRPIARCYDCNGGTCEWSGR